MEEETVVAQHAGADRAMRRWVWENPAHAQWILDGYPTMTDEEHVERFGKRYEPPPRRPKPAQRP